MPIKFNCAKCQKAFTVADTSAGKQGRCNDCGHMNTIPDLAATASTGRSTTSNVSATYEVTSAVNGAVFGPADQSTLKQWVQEGRVTPECQVKKVGTEDWKPAKSLFPKLREAVNSAGEAGIQSAEIAEAVAQPVAADPFANFKSGGATNAGAVAAASTAGNPYAAGTAVKKQLVTSGEVVPTTGEIGFILSHAFDAFKAQMGVMIGGFLIYMVLAMVNGQLPAIFGAAIGTPGLIIGFLLNLAIAAYIVAGMLNLSFNVARGEPARVSDLFSAGDRVLPLLGFTMLIYLMMLIPAAVFGLVLGLMGNAGAGAGNPEVMGITVFVLAMVFLVVLLIFGLLFWPSYFLIADRKTKVFQSFSVGMAIGKKNILQFIAINIIAGLVGFAGLILLIVGVIFTGPLAFLIIATSYLVMSGQIRK